MQPWLRNFYFSRLFTLFRETILGMVMAPVVFTAAIIARFISCKVDIGLGPEPLINNIYHRQALIKAGYSAETFVNQVYFITKDFDYRGDLMRWPWKAFLHYFLFIRLLFRYKGVYVYFHGGPLAWTALKAIEPLMLKLAKKKVVIMPYGGDIQDLSVARNLNFKHAMASDYPGFKYAQQDIHKRIRRWTRYANHVISGCDWVFYSYHWDTLLLGHFSIDTEMWLPTGRPAYPKKFSAQRPLRLFHAPNHKTIKGTRFFLEAVANLQQQGLHIELTTREKVPNSEIRKAMTNADIVLDQLVIGWYAMFAIESMSMEKPVVCFLDDQLVELFEFAGVIEKNEIPIINANFRNIEQVLKDIYTGKIELNKRAKHSRQFVLKHHSLTAMGRQFERINRSLGIEPSQAASAL